MDLCHLCFNLLVYTLLFTKKKRIAIAVSPFCSNPLLSISLLMEQTNWTLRETFPSLSTLSQVPQKLGHKGSS